MTEQYPRLATFFSDTLASLSPPRPLSSTLTVFVASALSAFLVPTSRKGIPILNKSFLTAATSLLSFPAPSLPASFRFPPAPRSPYLASLFLSLSLSFFPTPPLCSRLVLLVRMSPSLSFPARSTRHVVVDSWLALMQSVSDYSPRRYFVYTPSLIAGSWNFFPSEPPSVRYGDKIAIVF